MRAVAYIRVSTDKEEQAMSLENQREFFEKYIVGRGDELVEIFSDKGKSATKMKNRPAIQQLLKMAERGEIDKLYVKDISRLARNTLDFINTSRNLTSWGVTLHIVNMGEGRDIDPFMLNLMAMIAEQESQNISQKVKFGKKLSKERGIVPNFVFGYQRLDKFTLEADPVESVYVKKIFDLYTEEGYGMSRIAEYLRENKVKTKKKKNDKPNYDWSQVSVSHILTNQIYIGKVINGKETTISIYDNKRQQHREDEWFVMERPEFRLISDAQFAKAQKKREENSQKFTSGRDASRRSEAHIFSNLIRCGDCGYAYRRNQRQYSPNTKLKVWWTCSKRCAYGKASCTAPYIRIDEDWLLEGISNFFEYLIADKEAFYKEIEKQCENLIKSYVEENTGADLEILRAELEDKQDEREKIKKMFINDVITEEEMTKDMKRVNKEIEILNMSLVSMDATDSLKEAVKASLKEFYKNLNALTLGETLTNTSLKKIVDKIVVNSKDDIVLYIASDSYLDDIKYPVKLSGVFLADTDTKSSTQRYA